MNYATALTIPSWATEAQTFINKTAFYTPIVWKAFNKTIVPVLAETTKGFAIYCYQSEQNAQEWTMNFVGISHNPLKAAVASAYAELTSVEAQATYRRVRHLAGEAATLTKMIGLWGVVAVTSGIELAQKIYAFAKRGYKWADGRINPPLEQPTLLPTVDLCLSQLSHEELAARIDNLADVPSLLEVADNVIASHQEPTPPPTSAPLQPAQAEDCPAEAEPVDSHPSSIVWNPAPKDIHAEVQQRLEAIALADDGAIAPEATAALAMAEDMLVGALDVPGATGKPKRPSRKKAVETAIAQPRKARGQYGSKVV